jgi:dUTP pyrophosphatase
MTVKVPVSFKKLDPRALPWEYATRGSAGADVRALEDMVCPPGVTTKVRTGIAVEIPVGWQIEMRPRSGLACKIPAYDIPNSPGTIDSDYRGEVLVPIRNLSDKPWEIQAGERLCQAVLDRSYQMVLDEVDELTDTERGLGGFGSTGIR